MVVRAVVVLQVVAWEEREVLEILHLFRPLKETMAELLSILRLITGQAEAVAQVPLEITEHQPQVVMVV
jgi:hypothetical protein